MAYGTSNGSSLSARVRALLEPYYALNDRWRVGARQAHKVVKRVVNRAKLTRVVTPHVLRQTWATLALRKGMSLAAVAEDPPPRSPDHDRHLPESHRRSRP